MMAIGVSGMNGGCSRFHVLVSGWTLLLKFSKPGSTPVADYASATERERAVMNDAAWWARVVQARTERDDPETEAGLGAPQRGGRPRST
jgi:hypothetical protein